MPNARSRIRRKAREQFLARARASALGEPSTPVPGAAALRDNATLVAVGLAAESARRKGRVLAEIDDCQNAGPSTGRALTIGALTFGVWLVLASGPDVLVPAARALLGIA